MKTILFIDGQNLLKNINTILWRNKKVGNHQTAEWKDFNFLGLFEKKLQDFKVDEKIFYISKVGKYPQTKEKSKELIERNRLLKLNLENQGFQYIIAGRVRGRFFKREYFFDEKGVDVRLAIDMVLFSLIDKTADTLILASSDSDLQPAIKLIKEKSDTKIIYLGFQNNLNKGLVYTTNDTVKIQDEDVVGFYKKQKPIEKTPNI